MPDTVYPRQGCSVLKIFRVSLRGSEAGEAISGLQCGDCFGKMRLAMTYNRRTEQPWYPRRLTRTLIAGLIILLLLNTATTLSPPLAYAEGPQPNQFNLLAACGLGQIKSVNRATLTRSSVAMTPGSLFSDSGNFPEKPVDTPCESGEELGPFPVMAGGKLIARIVGSPAVPNTWSLHNYNTSMVIVYEPFIGGEFGSGQEILKLAGEAEDNDLAGEATWPGPGRLRAYIGPPSGSGPLTGACFGQSYSAQAEIVELYPEMAVQPGLTLQPGDRITTDGFGNLTVNLPATGSSLWIGPNSQVSFETQTAGSTPQLELPEYILGLHEKIIEFEKANLPMAQGYYDGTPGDFLDRYNGQTKKDAYDRIKNLSDPCEAAVTLKLFLEAHPDQWTAANTDQKLSQLGWDLLLIWRLPNEWNALEKLAEWTLRPVPVFGTIANIKNTKDTYDRIMKEVFDTTATLRAKRMSTAFESSRGWTPEQVQARQSELDDLIAGMEANVRQARIDLDKGIEKLDAQLREKKCYTQWEQEANRKVCAQHVADYHAAHYDLRYQHHHRVRELMSKILETQTEKYVLETYRSPLAADNCAALKEMPPARPTEETCVPERATLGVGTGRTRVFHNPLFPAQIINVGGNTIVTKGTELVIDKQEDSSMVTVIEGQVEVTTPAGQVLEVSAGQQLSLPDRQLSDIDPAADDGGLVSGIPLRDLPLNDAYPEPYGTVWADFQNNGLPAGWLWQDTDPNHRQPGDAGLETPTPGVLQVTVPNENDFWGHRDDAPRLLRKVTGDFDLEGELLLECEGLHLAISEFLIFAPGRSAGYLKGQFYPEDLKSQYLIVGGGWYHLENLNKLPVINRQLQTNADPPDGPVRFKLSRRGEMLKSYWSVDGGQSWTLASRERLSLPETLWVGWLFKRMAHDGLHDVPAVTTLQGVKLQSGPLGSMREGAWDVVGFTGTVTASDTGLVMTQDGTQPGYVQAYSPWFLPGDFDLTVRFDAPPVDSQPDQERYIHVAVTSNDEKNHAYVRNALTSDGHRYDADMAINAAWYRYRSQDTQDSTGRLRLVRQDGIFSGYIWQNDDWVLLGDWTEGFTDPVYLDLRYEWKSPTPDPQSVTFTIERLVTPEGDWFGPVESVEPAVSSQGDRLGPKPEATPTQPATRGDLLQPSSEAPFTEPESCSQAVAPQLAASWDRTRLGCPSAPGQLTWAAVQAFERGLMLWRSDTGRIYVFAERGFWLDRADEWQEGLALLDRGQPPAGLLAPVRGFGYLWASDEIVFSELGWARWPESGFCAVVQPFEFGLMIRRSETAECQGQPSSPESGWFGGVDLFNDGSWR